MLVVANLHDSGALMPHYTLQLLALLAALPRGSAFLSVYESGSTDDTGTLFGALFLTFDTVQIWTMPIILTIVALTDTRSIDRKACCSLFICGCSLCRRVGERSHKLVRTNRIRYSAQGCGWRHWRPWWRRWACRTASSRTAASCARRGRTVSCSLRPRATPPLSLCGRPPQNPTLRERGATQGLRRRSVRPQTSPADAF